MRSFRRQDGQVIVIFAVMMVVMLAMAGLVLDVGSWFRADRQAQTIADAAALAGAQALPQNTQLAAALADEYANENGGADALKTVSFSSSLVADDTIAVGIEETAPAFFAKIFGIDSVKVHGRAVARVGAASAARGVAPIVIDKEYLKQIDCLSPPADGPGCPASLDLLNLHEPGGGDAAGNFGLIDLAGGSGSVGSPVLAQWVLEGYEGYMPVEEWYDAVPSTKFNDKKFRDAMSAKIGEILLFPIFTEIIEGGSTATYYIVGWVGFELDGFSADGKEGEVWGRIKSVIWDGIISETAQPALGTRVIRLIE